MHRKTLAMRRERKARGAVIEPRLAITDLGNDEAEIIMYGDVMENDPVDWWTGEPTGELAITSQRFLDELDQIRNAKHVTVRLNSGGGDLFTGMAIHNALKGLTGKVTVHIDGLAASAASVIACAGDEVVVHPGSMFMIHEGYIGMYGWYTPAELDTARSQCTATTQSMINTYMGKTGQSEADIRELIEAETWFVGQEIIDAGFADTLAGDCTDEETDDGEVDEVVYDEAAQVLTVRGIQHDASMYRNIPKAAAIAASTRLTATDASPAAEAIDMATPPQAAIPKGETHMSETAAELRASCPDLVAEIEASAAQDAAQAERARIQAIDEIAAGIPSDLVAKAKFEEPCTAAELALASVKASKAQAESFLAAADEDADESNADDVDSDPNGGGTSDDDEDKEAEASIKAAAEIVNGIKARKAH